MAKSTDVTGVNQIYLEKFKIAVMSRLPPEMLDGASLKFSDRVSFVHDEIVYYYTKFIAGQKLDHLAIPDGKWETFKNAFFPPWALKKYPVKMLQYDIRALYPKVVLPKEDYTIVTERTYEDGE